MAITLLYESHIDTVAVTSGAIIPNGPTEAADMPAVNVIRPQPTDIWRCPLGISPHLTFDLGSAKSVQQVFIGYTNSQRSGDFDVIGASTAALLDTPGSAEFYQQNIPLRVHLDGDLLGFARHHGFLHLSAPVSLQHWRVVFNTITPFECGRVMLGNPFIPVGRGPDFGVQVAPVERSSRQRGLGGQLFPGERGKFREVRFRLSWLNEGDAFNFATPVDRIAGTSKPVLFAWEPTDERYLMDRLIYGVLTGVEPLVSQRLKRFRKAYTIEEMELP